MRPTTISKPSRLKVKDLRRELHETYYLDKVNQCKHWPDDRERNILADMIDDCARSMTRWQPIGYNKVLFDADEFDYFWQLLLDANPELKDLFKDC